MKTYEANQELEVILESHGFSDCADKLYKASGKKKFKQNLSSNRAIRFDHINIKVDYLGHYSSDSKIKLTEQDLRAVLFAFKVSSVDFSYVLPFKEFKFQKVSEGIDKIRKRLETYRELKSAKREVVKMERILNIYDDIVI